MLRANYQIRKITILSFDKLLRTALSHDKTKVHCGGVSVEVLQRLDGVTHQRAAGAAACVLFRVKHEVVDNHLAPAKEEVRQAKRFLFAIMTHSHEGRVHSM